MFDTLIDNAIKTRTDSVSLPLPPPVMGTTTGKTATEKSTSSGQNLRAEEKTAEENRKEEKPQVSEKMLKELARDIETIHSIGLIFSKHEETGRTVIKVLDKDSNKVIREIPSEDVLNLAAKIDEMIGILFDKKV